MRGVALVVMLVAWRPIVRADDGGVIDRPGGAAAGIVQRFIDEAVARERAESGNVPPVWRDCERDAALRFNPKTDDVSPRTVATLLLEQYRSGLAHDPRAALRAGVSPYEQPAEWQRIEIEVAVDATGKIIRARVVLPSGRARLDAAALAAVRAAVEDHPPSSANRRVTVRFLVEAGVAVIPPEVDGMSLPGTTRPNGAVLKLGQIQFDETTGRVSKPDYLLKKVLHTRIKLLGIASE
jgi:TonB family protein